jgi:hypothetical protein
LFSPRGALREREAAALLDAFDAERGTADSYDRIAELAKVRAAK